MPELNDRMLSPDEQAVINLFRSMEANMNSQIDMLRYTEADQRCVDEAQRYAELTFIYMMMAVIKPKRPTDPTIDEAIKKAVAKDIGERVANGEGGTA